MESTQRLFDAIASEDFRKAREHIGVAVEDIMKKRVEEAQDAVRKQYSDEYGS